MNEIKNPYNYDLAKAQNLFVTEEGNIVGYNQDKLTNSKRIKFPDGTELKVLGVKKILIVEVVKEGVSCDKKLKKVFEDKN